MENLHDKQSKVDGSDESPLTPREWWESNNYGTMTYHHRSMYESIGRILEVYEPSQVPQVFNKIAMIVCQSADDSFIDYKECAHMLIDLSIIQANLSSIISSYSQLNQIANPQTSN